MAGKKDDGGGRKSQKQSESNDEGGYENGYDEEPDFSDPEDFVDDISDEGSYRNTPVFIKTISPASP